MNDARPLEPGRFHLLNILDQSNLEALRRTCDEQGWPLWSLRGEEAGDAAALFARARQDLPSPFPQRPVDNWTAFSDNLWEAAAVSGAETVVLAWSGAHAMLQGGLPDLLRGTVALQTLARKMLRPASPNATPITLYTFILGEGPNFP